MFTIQAMFATDRSTQDMRSSEGVLRYRDKRSAVASRLKVLSTGTQTEGTRTAGSLIDLGFESTYFSADRISAARGSERKFSEIKTMWSDRT